MANSTTQQAQRAGLNAADLSVQHDHDYAGTTNHRIVTHAVESLVHPALRGAWAINNHLPMAYIFDAVCPARRWKKGMPYDDEADYPDYDSDHPKELTYTNGPPPGLMPFNVKSYKQVVLSMFARSC